MSKLRIKNRFGMTPNWLLNSKEITLKAKGLYGYLQSKPDGWTFSITGICTQCVENRTAIRTALKELEDLKVLVRQQIKGDDGRFTNEYILFDRPYADDPYADEPYTENLYTKKERVSKKEISNKDKDKKVGVFNTTFNPDGAKIIKELEKLDPKNKRFYGNKTQRKHCDFLINEYGLDETIKAIQFVVVAREKRIRYLPSITSPAELVDKWQKLLGLIERKEAEVLDVQSNFV